MQTRKWKKETFLWFNILLNLIAFICIYLCYVTGHLYSAET